MLMVSHRHQHTHRCGPHWKLLMALYGRAVRSAVCLSADQLGVVPTGEARCGSMSTCLQKLIWLIWLVDFSWYRNSFSMRVYRYQ